MRILREVHPFAEDVSFGAEAFTVILADGREISTPLSWFPRLRDATPQQRAEWELIGGGIGIHWPAIDEDISVESLLSLKPMMVAKVGVGGFRGYTERQDAK
ncbi:MAG: DUF2442 domain-containing protein [Gemmatimonadaceae bacterium]